MGRLIEVFRRVEQANRDHDAVVSRRDLAVPQSTAIAREQDTLAAILCLVDGFERLQGRCPPDVDIQVCQQAVQDAGAFVLGWGQQAALLGWTCQDVFGAAEEDHARRESRRLSATGLIWALNGRQVIALTENAAATRSNSGRLLLFLRDRGLLVSVRQPTRGR